MMESKKEHITVRLIPDQFCLNCQGVVYNQFCSDCGQRHIKGHLTFNLFLNEFISKLFGLDSSIFRTLKGVFRPGVVCREYLNGQRVKYMKPLHFYLAVLAISLFFQMGGDPTEGWKIRLDIDNVAFKQSFQNALDWMFTQQKLIQLLSVPFFAFFTTLLYRKKNYTYLENLVLWLYIKGLMVCLSMLLFILIPLLFKFLAIETINPETVVRYFFPIIYSTYAMIQTFEHYSLWGVIKALMVYILSIVSSFIITMIGVTTLFAAVDYFFL